ncbi:MAG TPA: hypothetical protein DHW34_00505, partial [Actinobacteria bacterium]|nr:hypothetical protein [Actinomycetota bacterium]
GPTGGSLTANGTSGTTAGAWSTASSGWSVSRSVFSADAGAGYASTSQISREESVDGTCTSWNNASTSNSFTETTGKNGTVTQDRCYRYTLTGTDNVGNTTVLTVTVAYNDTSSPTQSLSLASATNAVISGSGSSYTLYYRSDLAGSFTIADAVTDGASGPKQVVFPAISTTGWTHNSETVTTNTGTRPTLTFTSSTFSWNASPSAPTSKTISASDNANNPSNSTLNFTADVTAPTGGSIVIGSTTSSSAGTTGFAPAAFTGTVTNFSDAGVGIDTNVIARSTATLTGSTCGTFGTAVTVSSISESSSAGLCFKYTLTGTDLLGNTASTTITVKGDAVAPTVSVSQTGSNSYLNGSTLYYRSGQSGSFTLTASVSDSGSGAASATFPAVSGATGWTHAAETVSSASSTSGSTKSYTSSAFSWTNVASNPSALTVTGTDVAGNDGTQALTLTADSAAPTGGALSVASTSGTSGGATAYSKTGTFSGTYTLYSADAGSGFASSTVTKETASISGGGTCGAYTSATAPTGGTISETTLANGCYRYTVTGTDNVGNVGTLRVIVIVDKTAPTQAFSTTSSTAYVSGTTVYYNGSAGSGRSMTLTDSVTDNESGPLSVTFPSLGGTTTGWTFTSNTDSGGLGSGATLTFTSNSLSWSLNTTSSPTMAVVATDSAGNTNTSNLTFTNDVTAPTGGALTVAGFTNTSTSNTSSNSSWSISTTNYTDAGSGIASNTLTVARANWNGFSCGSYGSTTDITGNTSYNNGGTTGCYQFILTGTDNVGNTASKTVLVRR